MARAFGARLIGGGDYVVARSRARAMAGALRSRGLLLYAQPDALRRTKQAVPDDPLSKSPDAWRAAVADPNLAPPPVDATSPLIALLDTRLDESHPEFAGSNVRTLGTRPLDNLHGTATAAVAAAPKNDVGILGVWPGARALNVPLPPDALTCSASARGVREAIRDGAAVINMSYGSQSLCRAEYAAIQLAVRRGIIPVAAAGNEFAEGNPLEFPASLPHVLTIAAVNARLDSSSFSNSNPAVDLSAPGESIMTAVPAALDDDGTPDGYTRLDGTSFSAPMVSAAVAWVRQARPDLTPDQVAQVGAAVGARPRPRGLRQRHGLRAARRRRRPEPQAAAARPARAQRRHGVDRRPGLRHGRRRPSSAAARPPASAGSSTPSRTRPTSTGSGSAGARTCA